MQAAGISAGCGACRRSTRTACSKATDDLHRPQDGPYRQFTRLFADFAPAGGPVCRRLAGVEANPTSDVGRSAADPAFLVPHRISSTWGCRMLMAWIGRGIWIAYIK